MPSSEPLFVVKGDPDDDEVAALTAVLITLLAHPAATGATARASRAARTPPHGRFPTYDIPLSWLVGRS